MSTPHLSLRQFTLRVLVVRGLAALALFLWRVADVLLLGFGAALVALLLHAIADPIQRRTGVGHRVALAAAVLVTLLVLAGSAWLFGHEVSAQFGELLRRLPRAWNSFRETLQRYEIGRAILDSVQDPSASLGAFASTVPTAAIALSMGLLNALVVAFGGIYIAISPRVVPQRLSQAVPR
jgi:predicted PurR-regulated permease PerM